jgi:hypothetical protein
MAGSHGDGDLIAAIYDAIIEPSRWDEVVKRIVEATKSFSGNLVLQQANAGSLTALYNVDPSLPASSVGIGLGIMAWPGGKFAVIHGVQLPAHRLGAT